MSYVAGVLAAGASQSPSVGARKGQVIIYMRKTDGSWFEQTRLNMPGGAHDDYAGISVSLDLPFLLVGAFRDDDMRTDSGSAHLFERVGEDWNAVGKLWSPQPANFINRNFGRAVLLRDQRIIIAEPGLSNGGFSRAGAVHVFDLQSAGTTDCNNNGIPDECELNYDCNDNGQPDICDIAGGLGDCDGNLVFDVCEISFFGADDCNVNGVPDECELLLPNADCNGNGIPDACDAALGLLEDCNNNGIDDACERNDYALEDGVNSDVWSAPGYDQFWMNRFVVQSGSEWINSVSIFVSPYQTPGVSATVVVYRDPNGDGKPFDAEYVSHRTATFDQPEQWKRIPIDPSFVGQPGDYFFVAAIITNGPSYDETMYMTISDRVFQSVGESWWGFGTPGSIDYQNLTDFDDYPLQRTDVGTSEIDGPWLLRADGTHFEGAPAECMCPGDIAGADNAIDVLDLMALLENWGDCGSPCAPFCDGDLTGTGNLPDCKVNVADLFALLSQWGECN